MNILWDGEDTVPNEQIMINDKFGRGRFITVPRG